MTSEVCDIAEMTYEVDVEERLRLLERREKAVELLVMARYLQTWRNQHAGLYALFESVGIICTGYVIIPKPHLSSREGINSRCRRFDLSPF